MHVIIFGFIICRFGSCRVRPISHERTAHCRQHLPGVATPSEIQQALRHGATWLKAFPATVLGTGWFAAMRGPFPEVNLVATGGVSAHNAADYLAAGARAVAVGSALADETQWEALAALAASSTGPWGSGSGPAA